MAPLEGDPQVTRLSRESVLFLSRNAERRCASGIQSRRDSAHTTCMGLLPLQPSLPRKVVTPVNRKPGAGARGGLNMFLEYRHLQEHWIPASAGMTT